MIEFSVPLVPRACSRPRVTRNGTFMSKEYKATRKIIRDCYGLSYRYKRASTKPITLFIRIQEKITPSWPKWKQQAALDGDIAPTGKPDVDNITKSVLDALTGLVWEDDSQVVNISITQVFGEREHMVIEAHENNQLPIRCTQVEWCNHQSRHIEVTA